MLSSLVINYLHTAPIDTADIDAAKRVQRRFTKRLPGLSNYTFNERLSFLNIPSLEQRRMRADLICVTKCCLAILIFVQLIS